MSYNPSLIILFSHYKCLYSHLLNFKLSNTKGTAWYFCYWGCFVVWIRWKLGFNYFVNVFSKINLTFFTAHLLGLVWKMRLFCCLNQVEIRFKLYFSGLLRTSQWRTRLPSFRPKHAERQRSMRSGGISTFMKRQYRFLHCTHSAGAPCVTVEMTGWGMRSSFGFLSLKNDKDSMTVTCVVIASLRPSGFAIRMSWV